MTSIRIELDGDGIRSLLASNELQAELDRRATAVARAAQSRSVMVGGLLGEEYPLPVVTRSAGNSARARALVVSDHEAGLAVEAKHRLLVGSLDAAR